MSNYKYIGYHDATLVTKWGAISQGQGHTEPAFTYTFRNFFHPFVDELISKLNKDLLKGVLDASWQATLSKKFFDDLYSPKTTSTVGVVSFPKEIDVEEHGPYANYNWELFFHIPLTVAVHLSKTRRFAEAQRWFHFIFNPTSNEKSPAPPKRFWNFLAFRTDKDPKQIDYLLELLSKSPVGLSDDDKARQKDVLDGYQAMLDKPFQPHAIARTRHVAYQYSVVMKYLDNLIAWGDDLFTQDSLETINEATMLYVLASNILGPRPERVPALGTVQAKTFADLKAIGLDKMSNAMVDLEAAFPFNLSAPTSDGGEAPGAGPLFGIGRTLYFCIPRNDKLLSYWDTVADRLFKIRHCMNIQGVVRPLALFDPPIDPGMLVAAAAAGLDISSIVSGLNQPIGPVRCQTLIQKSIELCGEVRALGGSLLAALEKGDGEHLARIRQGHEIQIQQLTQEVRFLQWKNAEESTKSLLTVRSTAIERLRYYQRLLALPNDPNAPDAVSISRPDLTEDNFGDVYNNLVGQYDKTITLQTLPQLKIAGTAAPAQQSGASGAGRLFLNTNEDADLNIHAPNARDERNDAVRSDTITGVLALIPDMGIDLHFWGLGGHANLFGGTLLASAGRLYSSLKNTAAADEEGQAASSIKTATHERRSDDWILQYNLAAHELMQNGRQLLTSLIAEQLARHEYLNVKQQIANSQEVDRFLHDKFTNEELYLWMQGETSRLYYEYYRFAFDTARKAERTMKQELMRPELDSQTFVRFNYWDSGRKGLLSGEALHLDLKRMEMAYHDNNKRELELTRHVSLRQLDPLALLQLKQNGTCQVSIPEWLYDKDCPGHYMRRIKSVALSIPSVTGPYTGVHCTLSLLRSSIRKSPIMKDGEYARQGAEDDRFVDYTGAIQSVVTSSGSNDSGMFETNLRDERFLPFEGAGAVSAWKLDLPLSYPAFDYSTISDVILHVRYTARQGVIADKVKSALDELFSAGPGPNGANLALLFSLSHDFPIQWSAFVNGAAPLSLDLKRGYFPYFTHGKEITIGEFQVYAADGKHHTFEDPAARSADLHDHGTFTVTAGPDGPGPAQVLTRTPGKEIFLIIRYST
jgi:hypothetical protein